MKRARRHQFAELVSTVVGPVPMGALLGVAVGIHSGRGVLAGAGWGLLSVLCAAVVPAAATAPLRRRKGRTAGRRLAYMTPAVAGALLGLAVLRFFPAPADVRVLALGFAAGLISSALINVFYAASNHVAALAGGTVLAVALIGPVFLIAALMIPLQAWSRVAVGAHSRVQVCAGAAVGAISAVIVVW